MKTLNRIFMGLVATVVVVSGANNRQSIKKELVSSSFNSGVTTLNWVIKYDTNTTSPLKDVVIKDTYSSAQTYTPNTEAHPNGWSVTQNPSGFTWETSNGLGYSKPFPLNPNKTKVEGVGDGFAPIPYTALNGDKRFYYLNHALQPTDTLFGCIGECSNSTWPKKLPDGDPSSPDTSGTSGAPETVIFNRKLYYPVTRATDSGIGCYDLENDSECGYIKLSNLKRTGNVISAIDGLTKVGNALYIMDGNGVAYKVALSSSGAMSLAGSHNFSSDGMTSDKISLWINNPSRGESYGIGSEVVGNKVYFSKGSDTHANSRLACLDTSSVNQCSGWSGAVPATSTHRFGMNGFVYYNSSMTPTAICLSAVPYFSIGSKQCFNLNNGTIITSSIPFLTPNDTEFGIGFETTVGTKTYFPDSFKNNVKCFDWATGSSCGTNTMSGTKTYGVVPDDEGCLWVLGDQNILWSIDTGNGACHQDTMVIEDTYDASKNWCASKDVKWHYNQFKITGITPGEFSDLNVTFYDANGAVISTESIPTNGVSYSKGLSTGVFASNIPIHYKIEGVRSGTSDTNATPPVVTISVDGPPQEFCFQTNIPCPITGEVYNNATVGLKDAPAIDDRDEVVVDGELVCKDTQPQPPKQCLSVEPKLTCSKAGWRVELNSFTPANYSASNTDISVLASSGVTATKWGGKWYLNGANAGDTIRLNLHGADIGAGNFKDGDLCCDGEANVTIPKDQSCEPSYPEINVMKSYKDGVFKLHVGILGEIDAPQILTIIDRVPAGITITGIDPRSTSSWACSNSFPVTGSANLVCGYIGSMPVSGTQELFLTATIDSKESVTNCMDVGIIQSDGVSIQIDPQQASCVTVENNQTDDNNNTENNNTGCQTDADCPAGYCHQGMCIVPDNNSTDGGTDDNAEPDGTACDDNNASTINDMYINGVCIGEVEDNSNSGGIPVDGTPCNDDDPSTINEVYINGVCIGIPIDNNNSGTNPPTDGTACDDHNASTINDTYINGICVGTTEVDSNQTENNNTGCQTDADCPAGYCHQGMCIVPDNGNNTPTDGVACDDHNTSTINDSYVNGACIGTPIVITPIKPDVKPKPIIDKPKPVDDKPKPLIVVPRGNLSLYKRGPKVCKAGGICTFTLTVKNRGRGRYSGPVTVQDKSREFRGKLIRTRGKGWRCRTTRGGYVCNNPKLRLRAGASSQIKLSIHIPKRAKGYLTNCAKLDVLQGSNRVRAIQTMLLAAGYNIGGVNGSMNKRTIRALKAYARASGLKGKKAQRVAIKRLLAKYPFIRSKNSCVKVKIKESKPECKRGQHFNGKQCVTCPRGSYWDKKHRRCVAKQVVKTCPRGYVLYKNRCYKEQRRSECPRGQEIDRRTGTCKKKLDVGTVLNIINVVGHIIGGGGGGKHDAPRDYKH